MGTKYVKIHHASFLGRILGIHNKTETNEAKKLKAAGELTEDGLRDVQNEVQKLTDRFVKSIDDHLKRKEAEVMKV